MAQLNKKQTSMLVLISLAVLFLGYQIYKLVSDDVSMSPASAKPVAQVQQSSTTGNTALTSASAAKTASTMKKVQSSQSHASPVVMQKQTLQPVELQPTLGALPLAKNQKQYLKLVNLYALAKMKRQLLNEEADIAEAQQRIAALHAKTEQTITGDAHAAVTPFLSTSNAQGQAGQYRLSYLAQQNGSWSATLVKDGQYQQVAVGTLLLDGSKVLAISKQGVNLQLGKRRALVTFKGSVPLKKVVPVKQVNAKGKITPQKKTVKLHAVAKKPAPVVPKKKPIQYAWHKELLFNLDGKNEKKISPILKLTSVPVLKLTPSLAPTPIPAPVLKSTLTPKPTKQFTEDEHLILLKPGNHYTLQLIGSYDKTVIHQFIKDHHLQGQVHLFNVISKYKNKRWYMLVYGDYSSQGAAVIAGHRLDFERPWVRRYSNIQHAILTRGGKARRSHSI